MLKSVSKLFTGILAVSCLSVAAVNVRLMMNTSHSVNVDIPAYNFTSKLAENKTTIVAKINTSFDVIAAPVEEIKIAKKFVVVEKSAKIAAVKSISSIETKQSLINYDEPVKLNPIRPEYSLPTNLVSLMDNLNFKSETMIAANEEVDTISTTLAANINEEPVFFEYPVEKKEEKAPIVAEVSDSNKVVTKDELEEMADEFIAFDYSKDSNKQEASALNNETINVVSNSVNTQNTVNAKKSEQPIIQNVASDKVAMTSQDKATEKKMLQSNIVTTQNVKANNVAMSIHVTASNLKTNKNVNNYEVRFQDDHNEIYEDFGTGSVNLATQTSSVMNRSLVVLKRGYAPTNTDLIVENNSKVTLPLIEEEVFNMLLDEGSKDSSVGALLVELDDETESVIVDTDLDQEVLLDSNLKVTHSDEYRYKLITGLEAGNVFVTYKHFDGSEVSKIVHIHEREVTFEANIYDQQKKNKVSLYEEGLLSKELAPLILKGDQVRQFASENGSKKLSQNTYEITRSRSLAGERTYLEVNHLEEPVFVGYKENTKLALPDENFMRFILSSFEDKKIGNRCIVQLNIDAPVASYFVGVESAGSSIITSSQVLDADGKFYHSVGPKSQKVIIVGENHGALAQDQDAKINIKIDYMDGSTKYLSSYCSPNTYIVEQL